MSSYKFQQLKSKILEESISNNWNDARNEWELDVVWQSDIPKECLCGHNPIINICVLINMHTKLTLEVGNICVNKFMGISEGGVLFNSINKCYKDLNKSMGKIALDYMVAQSEKMDNNNDCRLNDWEIEFYTNTLKRRKLTKKQNKHRVIINKKFLKYTVRKLKNRPIK